MSLLDQLRDKRATARTAAEAVLTRTAETGEPMTAEDLAKHARAVADEAAHAIEAWHADQLAEIRPSNRLDVVADAMDAARVLALADVYPVCTEGTWSSCDQQRNER